MRKSPQKRRATRLGKIEHDILDELTFGDILISFLCSAHSTRAFYRIAYKKARERYHRRLALERLESQGYVQFRGEYASINATGRELLGRTIANVKESLKNRTWDRKWRIITFDIPERYRQSRNKVRGILKRAGFLKLQNSTWIFPHECEELSRLLKSNPRLSRHILYGVLEKIQDDALLRRRFFSE